MEKRRLAAIMFTDVVGYTRLMGMDEDEALSILSENRKIHKTSLNEHRGRLLKEIGDGMLCSFESASDAIQCATDLVQRSHQIKELKLRIGIHIGEVIFSNHDVFGDGVNIASRIQAMAIPDSVLISGKVFEEIRNKKRFHLKPLGKFQLKNDVKERDIYAVDHAGLKLPDQAKVVETVIEEPEKGAAPPPTPSLTTKAESVKRRKSVLTTPRVGLTLLFSLMAVAFGSFLFIGFKNSRNVRWAKEELLPEVARMADSVNAAAGIFGHHANTIKAFAVANQVQEYIEGDARLNDLFDEISNIKSVNTEPEQASVYIKSFHDPKSQWKLLGISPMDSIRFPLGLIRIKIEKEGFETIEDLIRNVEWTEPSFSFTLPVAGSVPEGMVYCQASSHNIDGEQLILPAHYMDKFEVTNEEYKQFINDGGYQKQDYWKYPIISDRDSIPWQEAMRLFRDQSNQPGPSTWIAGDYPEGKGNHPVMGISWYEAAAYASYVGKQLPTRYDFDAAAMANTASEILPFANFSNSDSWEVAGDKGSLHRYGLYNLAGNAREWGFNNYRSGGRLILGGGWNDFDYVFTNEIRQSNPVDRSISNGIRCVQFIDGEPDERFFNEFDDNNQFNHQIKLASDAEFKAILDNYQYDHTPLKTKVEYSRIAEEWTEEKITFNAAYGNERMAVYLFLPHNTKPPYQCIVQHPGTGARHYSSSEGNISIERLDFIVKTGRAALFPVFKGMYERNDWYGKNPLNRPEGAYQFRDDLLMRGKDLRRSIDYLETRNDINAEKIAYFGISWGGSSGPVLIAIEPRFKAGVWVLAGIESLPLPEMNVASYLPRIKIPILILNGKYDLIFPLETSQQPLYDLLGTPPEHKKMILYNEGHSLPRNEMIKESLNWLDTYLGPVEPGI